MKLLLVLSALMLTGCARSTLAAFVPQLDVSLHLARTRDVAVARDERTRVVLGAWLRWQPLISDPAAGSAMSAAASITPCEVGDDSCLTEHTEAEAEVATLRIEAP